MSASINLPASLESQRTAKLQRQIRAIRSQLDNWDKCRCEFNDRQFMKLWEKAGRLRFELKQLPLFEKG
jgi:hypothetical protein